MITVNLTTTCQRLSLCRIALTSLLLQSTLPHKINLWISKEPYLRDEGIFCSGSVNQLFDSLPVANRSRINIQWVRNTGPYRKLMPILREAQVEDVIVTADDDIFYGEGWLNGLLNAYQNAQGKAVGARVLNKRVNFLGRNTSYLHWNLVKESSIVRRKFIITFGGGAVLTRSMFRERDIRDDSFLEVAPTADDLWYSKLLQLNDVEVVVEPSLLNELYFVQHNEGLINDNWPKVVSALQKLRHRLWDLPAGYLGVPVCGNDTAYLEIERHFRKASVD